MKTRIMTAFAVCTFFLSLSQARAGEENTFRAIGKITESRFDHTTKHEHELKFVRLSDGEVFDIVESPELVKAHCESDKNPVVEIEGYRTGKFLFWGGDLVVTNFKVHADIEVPRMAHVNPESLDRPTRDPLRNSRL